MIKHVGKNWFSNFVPFDKPMFHRGIEYPTVEHYYQAMKTRSFKDRRKIANCKTPGHTKKLGRKVKLRDNWDVLKIRFMEEALRYKFRKGTEWHKKLIETEEEELIEWNYWHDNYWGNCVCQKCIFKESKNMLGILLMKLRREFRRM